MNDTDPPEPRLLRKGLEEEVYTGTVEGDVVPLSHKIAADLCGFVTEPDSRNVEYTTAPFRSYQTLLDRLMGKRCQLRRYLNDLGNYTLIPGSTLSLEESDEFFIANPNNPYYRYIRDTYGTSVVTASTHINVGIPDPDQLVAAYRLLRAEASMYLALTANSPFVRGRATGAHSNRWLLFPPTPPVTPFFTDHAHFRQWVTEQIAAGVMFNPRHLWLSIRPNGDGTPHQIERLELRICDRISRPQDIGAVVSLYEARIWQVLEDPSLDPLAVRSEAELLEICTRNEQRAARSSLDATVTDWRTGEDLPMREWIRDCWQGCLPTARAHGFAERLQPIEEILAEGNLAQQWLAQVEAGATPREVLQRAMVDLTEIDKRYDPDCPSPLPPGPE
ncbi:MAG: glutamate--cysteine ligase [Planctomycetes bacterium]|nr:glutamate--cysteine ligase [Planctomycetota bacterium]